MTQKQSKFETWYYGVIAAICGLVIAVPGVFVVGDLFSTPEVGDCATPSSTSDGELEMDEADCTSTDAAYRLVKLDTKKSCPEGDYLKQRASKAGKAGGSKYYCYVLNVAPGDCLKRGGAFHERVACGAGTSKVTKVVEGRSDRALCTGDDPKTYSEPQKTICITN